MSAWFWSNQQCDLYAVWFAVASNSYKITHYLSTPPIPAYFTIINRQTHYYQDLHHIIPSVHENQCLQMQLFPCTLKESNSLPTNVLKNKFSSILSLPPWIALRQWHNTNYLTHSHCSYTCLLYCFGISPWTRQLRCLPSIKFKLIQNPSSAALIFLINKQLRIKGSNYISVQLYALNILR